MKKIDFFKILSYAEVVSFGKAQRNRKIKDSHVNDFLNIIKDGKFAIHCDDGTYLPFGVAPIIVNPKTGHLLDGQHKQAAFVKAYEKGIIDDNARICVTFWYVEDEDQENLLTIMLNNKSKAWSIEDYMESYSQYLDSYEKLRKFCVSHQLCHDISKKTGKVTNKYRAAAAMMTGKNCNSILKAGTFTFSDEQVETANAVHDELLAIRKKLGLSLVGSDIEPMALAWHVYRNYMSVADIKALTYLPADVQKILQGSTRNRKNWETVFEKLETVIKKKSLKKVA